MPPKKIYNYLMEQMCDYIRGLDEKILKQGIRIWTPFTTNQGALLQEGNGYIIKDDGVMDEHDIFIKGGKLSPYEAIAKAMSKHYEKEHLKIIDTYLKLKPITTEKFTLKPDNGKYIIEEFDKFIKQKWSAPPTGLKGKDAKEIESARKALNYFSAILAFGEPYRRKGDMSESLDLIKQLIVNYISPTKTPIKKLLCPGDTQYPLVKKAASKTERNARFNSSEPMKKVRKKITIDSSIEEEEESSHSSDYINISEEEGEKQPKPTKAMQQLKKQIEKKKEQRMQKLKEQIEEKKEKKMSIESNSDSSDSYSKPIIKEMSMDSESDEE